MYIHRHLQKIYLSYFVLCNTFLVFFLLPWVLIAVWAFSRCTCCRFSRVRLCATPQTAAHQAPPSLGFSRQEHWSGLPFPSPMRDSEKRKGSRSVVSDSERPRGLQPTRLLCPWDFPGNSTGVGCHCLLPRCSRWGLLFVVVLGLLVAVASCVAGRGL